MPNQVIQNFQWRLETLSPTHQTVGKKFKRFDPLRVSPDESSGFTRAFFVEWVGSSSDAELTDLTDRVAEHD